MAVGADQRPPMLPAGCGATAGTSVTAHCGLEGPHRSGGRCNELGIWTWLYLHE